MTALIGTSGFSYDDWVGTWYPAGIARTAMLDYYADRFSALEINATYYKVPGRKTALSMIRRARGRLAFAIKAPASITHRRQLKSPETGAFLHFLEPFAEEGVLAAVLLQFPEAFHDNAAARRYLEAVGRTLAMHPTAVELRSATWDDPGASRELSEAFSTRVILDQPARPELAASHQIDASGALAYFRFHGRNSAQWYDSKDRHARYRYRYDAVTIRSELAPLVVRVSKEATSTLAFFNNHPDGHAPHDAATLAEALGIPPRKADRQTDLFADQ